ncbi:1342_t:CDS:2, partial [Ambispora leptoticha]
VNVGSREITFGRHCTRHSLECIYPPFVGVHSPSPFVGVHSPSPFVGVHSPSPFVGVHLPSIRWSDSPSIRWSALILFLTMFRPTEYTSSPPAYRSFSYCGKPEQSVLIGGRFVASALQNGYGHLHFDTHMEAAQFYHAMKERIFDGPDGRDGNVEFSHALYFNSKRLVEYGKALGVATLSKRERATTTSLMAEEVTGNSPKRTRDSKESATRELGESTEQSQDYKTDVAYRLYEDRQAFCIVLLTPGIKDKTEFEIAVADDDQFISIEDKFADNSASGKLIIESNPPGPFQNRHFLQCGRPDRTWGNQDAFEKGASSNRKENSVANCLERLRGNITRLPCGRGLLSYKSR